jgi:Asp-tRNA(Asn)/Glu-tRNA(Gln) amidotransferase A subunit family amidase
LVPGTQVVRTKRPMRATRNTREGRPQRLEDVAFWTVTRLASLIKSRQVTSVELTDMYLARLRRHNPRLNCVVTFTDELAMRQARQADQEIAAGKYRGPLHGIPWGVKDIFAVKGYPTSWGISPFKERVIDTNATVVERMTNAGAVLLAKLATGELALGDVWFGGQTKNPWNPVQGSGGSSAGPASAVSAGLVSFSVGTETRGSILGPSNTCGVTGFKPTFGRVSRHGVMAVNWSLDKVGPIARGVEDAALVLDAMHGPDDHDTAVTDVPFNWDAYADVKKLRVGFVSSMISSSRPDDRAKANDVAALAKLRELGMELVSIDLPTFPAADIIEVIRADDAAAFDDITRAHLDDRLVSQAPGSRPNAFRVARAVPAVEYLQAQRIRYKLMEAMARVMSTANVYVAPVGDGANSAINNLTGQPVITLPNGLTDSGRPTNFVIVGRVYGEADLLAVAKAYQDATTWHLKHPALD